MAASSTSGGPCSTISSPTSLSNNVSPMASGGQGALWRHQGLTFDAPFEMGVALAGPSIAADVKVEMGESKPLSAEPPGTPVAELKSASRSLYSVYEAREGYIVRFHGQCQFIVSGDATHVLCEPGPGADLDLVPVFMVGMVTALLLTLRGRPVMHGSAVCLGETTVVFSGPAGKGKTTVAALCCAAGARLVTDDIVPLVSVGDDIACAGLSHELRLREAAEEVAGLFPSGPPPRITADNRLAVRPALAHGERNIISAVVFPQPTRGSHELRVSEVPPSTAALQLLGNGRVPALVPMELQRSYFEAVTALANRVPVLNAFIPWGSPFSVDFVPELFDRVRRAVGGRQ
jgi:hypothetical protein